MKKLIFPLILGLCSLPAGAVRSKQDVRNTPPQDETLFKGINFSLGSHTEFYNAVQNNSSGGLRRFDFAPTFGVGTRLNAGWNHISLLPEITWVLPQLNEETRIIKNVFMLRADLAYDPLEWLRLRLGTSVMWLNQQGRGGTAQIANGNSTSTFYYPDENRSSLNNTFDVGLEAMLDKYALRFQTYTYSLLKPERRQISYSILLTYYWEK
jgi:hypothetical protein